MCTGSGHGARLPGRFLGRPALAIALLMSGVVCHAQRILYIPFDGSIEPREAAGSREATAQGPVAFQRGKFGEAVRVSDGAVLTYEAAGNVNKVRGTICVWVRPDWDGDDGKNHAIVADVADFTDKTLNTLYLWKWSVGLLRLDLREPKDAYITAPVSSWRAGEWHHVAATWDVEMGKRLYIDGELVASRESAWQHRAWPKLHVGSDWRGQSAFDGLLDDLHVYDVVLNGSHIRRVMAGKTLEVATVTRIEAPRDIRPGEPLVVHAEVRVPARLREDYPVDLHLGNAEIAVTKPYRPTTRWLPERETTVAIATVVPEDLYLPTGEYPLVVQVHGTLPARGQRPATAKIKVLPPRTRATPYRWKSGPVGQVFRDGVPMLKDDRGLLWRGQYLAADANGRELATRLLRSGRIRDALSVRLTDEVHCATESHDFREWGRSRVIHIGELGSFRVTGPPDSVSKKVTRRSRQITPLPAFSYRLRTSGRNRPHILVAEMPNDRERYTEIGVDVADGSRPARHLMGTGFGPRTLINLAVVYTGREYPCDGRLLRQALLFFPKSDEVEVIISSSGRELDKTDASGAAVSRLAVYEMTDVLRNAWNEIPETPGPKRSVSLFYPNVPHVYTQYGFSGATREQRLASFRAMCHYLKFVGIN
ncbi:MAG: LamG domain-containing protein, partial [Armatimonadota bacterium]